MAASPHLVILCPEGARAAEGSLLRLNASSMRRCFAEAQHDKRPGWLSHHSTGHITLVGALSTATSMKCQVGSLPVPCHPLPGGRPRSRRISLRSTLPSQGRFLAAARNDNERWCLSHHNTGHSLPAPCHPEAAAEGSLLRLNASSGRRCFAAARNDNERWRLSHHSTGHITLVGALSSRPQ